MCNKISSIYLSRLDYESLLSEFFFILFQACSSRDSVTREVKDVAAKVQKERELFKSQEKEYVERMEKYKQQIEKLNSELTSTRGELETANKRISELQREFTDKQKEFTEKLDKYLKGNGVNSVFALF